MGSDHREYVGGTAKKKVGRRRTMEELRNLGHQLLSSRAHINNLPVLLAALSSAASSPNNGKALECLLSLQSFFTPLVADLPPSSSKHVGAGTAPEDAEAVYRTWLRAQFDQFVTALVDICAASELDGDVKDVALDAIMEFVKLGKGGGFQFAIYLILLRSLIYSTASNDAILELLSAKFFKFLDVRYYTYMGMEKIAKYVEQGNVNKVVRSQDDGVDENGLSKENIVSRKMHRMLMCVPPLVSESDKPIHEMWSRQGLSGKEAGRKSSKSVEPALEESNSSHVDSSCMVVISKKLKQKFTKAWLSFLRLPLPLDIYKEVLAHLHQTVIPYMKNPVVLCDFLTRSYDIGGVISVMALSSLFILMTQHGLEYPNFYEKLYALLVPAVFLAKYRARFFELLDSCLKSPLLPAYLAAAFAKKLSRLALSVPPSGSLVIIAIIHNLLRRHPSINCLVHQEYVAAKADDVEEKAHDIDASSVVQERKRGVDPFKFEESDPMKSDAMRSSLWEIDTLRHHYCPAVSRFMLSLEIDLTVRAKTTEMSVKDFSSGSYGTIFKHEIGRRMKQVPRAFYKALPTSLFSESDFPGWSFEDLKSNEEKVVLLADDNLNDEVDETNSNHGDNQESAKRQKINNTGR